MTANSGDKTLIKSGDISKEWHQEGKLAWPTLLPLLLTLVLTLREIGQHGQFKGRGCDDQGTYTRRGDILQKDYKKMPGEFSILVLLQGVNLPHA